MRFQMRLIGTLACSLTALAIATRPAHAVVQVTGNVWLSDDASVDPTSGDPDYTVYADDPFTTTINEGIPGDGNTDTIDPFRAIGDQIEYEGRPDEVADTNINFDIIVGRSSSGEMIVNGSVLRDQNLIIGDQATINGVIKRGSGVVRIEGFGSTYNNDPSIIPYLGPSQDPDNPVSPSVVPRPDDVGFDLYVGRFGNGVLQLALGGRAEIQDAAIVGDQGGSVGTLLIDGVDSFLQSGGFEAPASDQIVHYMVIGRLGSGTMSITNGGQAYTVGPMTTGTTNNETFGTVIGSNMAADTSAFPSAGGQGTVYVDGTASKWTVAGNLQVGGFHDSREDGTDPSSPEDLAGTKAQYLHEYRPRHPARQPRRLG